MLIIGILLIIGGIVLFMAGFTGDDGGGWIIDMPIGIAMISGGIKCLKSGMASEKKS